MLPVEYFSIGGSLEGLPGTLIEAESNQPEIYGLQDGPKLQEYKVGLHSRSDFKKAIQWFRKRLPQKIKDIQYSKP